MGPSVNGLSLNGLFYCAQVAVEGVTSLSTQAIPILKESIQCINFVPQKTKDLDAEYTVLIAYQFLQKFVGNKQCVEALIERVKGVIQPAFHNLFDKQCIPAFLS